MFWHCGRDTVCSPTPYILKSGLGLGWAQMGWTSPPHHQRHHCQQRGILLSFPVLLRHTHTSTGNQVIKKKALPKWHNVSIRYTAIVLAPYLRECDSTAASESHIHQQGGGGFRFSSHAIIYPSAQASQASSKCNASAPINLTFSLYRQIN